MSADSLPVRLPRHFTGIPVLWSAHAAAPLQLRLASAGGTVAEIVADTPGLPIGFGEVGVARIGGHVIPREHWHRVRPIMNNPRALVTLEIELQGGGKQALGIVASIALMLVGALLAPTLAGAFFEADTFGFAAIRGLVTVGVPSSGSISISAIEPAP